MPIADLVEETSSATNTATLVVSGATTGARRFSAVWSVGATPIPVMVRLASNPAVWESGAYTLSAANTLTRVAIYDSSNGGAAVAFPAGQKTVSCSPCAKWFDDFARLSEGLTVADLTAGTPVDTDVLPFHRPGVGDLKVTVAALKAIFAGTAPPVDTTPPIVVSAQVANATPSRIDITFSESLANSLPAVGAFAVSGGKTVSSVSISGAVVSVTVNSAYTNGDTITVGYTQPGANPRIQDGAGNLAATFSGRAVTNNVGSTATAPAAPTIGTAVAGDGYVDVAFTRNSNGGSAVIDSTATLSTGQTATGTSSPIRVTAANGTAVTATVRDRNAIGSGPASAASNSVTPQAAPTTNYTITGFSGNAPKTTHSASASPVYGGLKQITPTNTGSNPSYPDYYTITPEPTSCVAGWGDSPTVPPGTVTQAQNNASGNSVNGMTPMAHAAGNTTFRLAASLWVQNGGGTIPAKYLWFKPIDGAAFCINAGGGLVVTGA